MGGLLIQLCIALTFASIINGQRDGTMEPRMYGKEVVSGVSMKLRYSNIFPDDNRFLVRMAFVETRFGEDPKTYNGSKSGGIWQVSEFIFNQTKSINTTTMINFRARIMQEFNINWEVATIEDLHKPMFSGLAIKLYIHRNLVPVPETLTEQANYWRESLNPNGVASTFIADIKELENESICQGRMDLVIALDGSESVGRGNFVTAKEFVVNLTTTFDKSRVRIAFIVYSAFSTTIFQLNNTLNESAMASAIRTAIYPESTTATHLAINSAIAMMPRNEGNSIPRVLIVFTDGRSNSPVDTITSAAAAKRAGIISFAVGIGSRIINEELEVIAGDDPSHVISTSSFDSLGELPYRINEETCNVPVTPPTTGSVTDNVNQNETRYFQYTIPAAGITIQISVSSGQVSGYFSYAFRTPSSAIYDGIISGPTFVRPPPALMDARQDKNGDISLYVAVQGTGQANAFEIKTNEGDHSGSTRNSLKWALLLCSFLISARY